MIIIKQSKIEKNEKKTRLMADIEIPENAYKVWIDFVGRMSRYVGYEKMYQYKPGEITIWYETEQEYGQYFCKEKNDAFLLAIVYFAMATGEDIKSLSPISNELYHNLITYLIPLHCNEKTGYKPISIFAETNSLPFKSIKKNGTGISCGVDSWDTVLRYYDDSMDEEHRLSALCLFNVGAFYSMHDMKKCMTGEMTVQEWHLKAQKQFIEAKEKAQLVADELKLPLVAVNSNISNLYQGVFLQTHAYRNCSAVLALQKYFSHYYYASAGEPEKSFVGLENAASDNVCFFSTDTLRFYEGSGERTRIEKLKYLSNYEIARKHLQVCCEETYNCGKCGKCVRTLLMLDLIGNLKLFKDSFANTEYYNNRKWKKYVWILDKAREDFFAKDIMAYIKKNKIKLPILTWIYHYTLPFRKMIKRITK